MRPLLFALTLALPLAALAAPAPTSPQADWRPVVKEERVKAGLTMAGWRLEEDGRALDPKTKAPATKAELDKAVLDLRHGARRAALEAVNMILDPKREPEITDGARLAKLAQDLPPGLAKAMLDPKSDLAKTRAMAVAELDTVASYFDGSRTMAQRQAAAQPVSAGTPGPRANHPYHTPQENSVGDKLRASAAAEISRDPYGRKVLARLEGPNGQPNLPPILIEEQTGDVVAQYDYRRGAIVLDRDSVLASVTGTVPPRQAAALRASLAAPAALLAYLDAHPEAVSAMAKDHDVLFVHELTHAWQDRRDPIFREMARGNLPEVQPLEYEEEAYKTKNLYIASKLKNDPASVKLDGELKDYALMAHGREGWMFSLHLLLKDSSPARAMPAQSIHQFQMDRLRRTQKRAVSTSEDQQAKALDLQALTRGGRLVARLESEHKRRMSALDTEIDRTAPDSSKLLGSYYLLQALSAARSTDRSVLLDRAERYAKVSGNKALIEEIRKAKK